MVWLGPWTLVRRECAAAFGVSKLWRNLEFSANSVPLIPIETASMIAPEREEDRTSRCQQS